MGRIDGKVAIVTGGGSGIGYATALLFAKEGAKVVAADMVQEGMDRLIAEVKGFGGEITSVLTDVTKESDIINMIKTAVDKYGTVDILVNNAGGTPHADAKVEDFDEAVFQKVIDLNFKGVVMGIKHVLPIMKANGKGSIINTSSGAGTLGDTTTTIYGSCKGAIITLTKYVATQYGSAGIRCNAVAPGLVMTEQQQKYMKKEVSDMLASHTVLGRNGKPEDIANAMLFLASDESSFITGHNLSVDGGIQIHEPYYADFMRAGKQISA